MDTLLAIGIRVRSAKPVLRITAAIDAIELAPGYPIARWRHDAAVPRDRRLQLLGIITQAPLLEKGRDAEEIVAGGLLSECFHGGRLALGVSAARAAGGLSVSMASDACWDTAWLDVTVSCLREAMSIEESVERVRHASAAAHVTTHELWLRELERLSVKDGRDLWDRRLELFPSLDFCQEVRQQLAEFRGRDPELDQVMKRLVELQRFFESWNGEPIGPDALPSKCSPESVVTLAKYKQEHTFRDPKGAPHVFSLHVRFTPGAGRIFFHGDGGTNKGLIGYIGKHKLPTVSDPT